jgi:hypothetical protein
MNNEPVEEAPKPEFTLNLDDLKPQEHRWVDRGVFIVCEGAGHPSHRSSVRTVGKREE